MSDNSWEMMTDESDAPEVSAAVAEMEGDNKATDSDDTSATHDLVERPLGEQTVLYPEQQASLMQLFPPHPKVRKGISFL